MSRRRQRRYWPRWRPSRWRPREINEGDRGPGGSSTGGLGGLLEQLQRAGFGDQANSWVSTGPNLPVSPDSMAQVFGRDGLAQIASRAGLSEQQTSEGLTEILPEVVDRLTPQGQMPEHEALSANVGDLERRLGISDRGSEESPLG